MHNMWRTSSGLAALANSPFLKVEATKFTELGYVGRDVESMVRDLTVLADVVGRNSSAALAFNDEEAAKEILSALSAETHIMSATIRDIDGGVLASYSNGSG